MALDCHCLRMEEAGGEVGRLEVEVGRLEVEGKDYCRRRGRGGK